MRRLILISLFGLFAASCGNTDKASNTKEQSSSNQSGDKKWEASDLKLDESKTLLIGFQTGVCYGKCPSYKVYVYTDGTYGRVGMMFTKTGIQDDQLTDAQLKEVEALVKAVSWSEIEEEYEFQPSDFPMSSITYSLNDTLKTTRYKAGEPESLTNLAKKLREIFDMYSAK